MINIAQYGLLIILSAALILHVCVLLKVVPYTLVWGGRLKSDKDMYRFEMVSIAVNLFFLFVIMVQSSMVPLTFPRVMMTILLWLMAALFLLNTLGNAVSKNRLEKVLFTPITLVLAVFSLILALAN